MFFFNSPINQRPTDGHEGSKRSYTLKNALPGNLFPLTRLCESRENFLCQPSKYKYTIQIFIQRVEIKFQIHLCDHHHASNRQSVRPFFHQTYFMVR